MSFFPDSDSFHAEQEARSAAAFATKHLRTLLLAFFENGQVRGFQREAGKEFGFGWFQQTFSHFPMYLDARKVKKFSFHDLAVRITKTEVWQVFFEVWESSGCPVAGVIFQVPHVGTYIAHNNWTLESQHGYTRLVRQARSGDKGMIVEPFAAFLEAISTVWQP